MRLANILVPSSKSLGPEPQANAPSFSLGALQGDLELLEAEQRSAAVKMSAMQSQAKGLEREYDRLLSEHDVLQRRLAQLEGNGSSAGDKKWS